MLELKQLRYLQAVYRYKNFTRASEVYFVSQPAISAAVTALEKELDVKLVNRSPKRVDFTIEGEKFMFYVDRILNGVQDAENAMQAYSEAGNNKLHLGVSPTLATQLLPQIYQTFLSKWPKASVYIREGSQKVQMKLLDTEMMDLVYNALPEKIDSTKYQVIPITKVEVRLIMSPDHPLAKYDKISFDMLRGVPMAMLNDTAFIRQVMDAEFDRHGIIPNIVSFHEQIICMFNMVKMANFVSCVNADPGCETSSLTDDSLIYRPFEEPVYFRVGYLMKSGRRLPRIAEELIEFTKDYAKREGIYYE